jgi:hypothetical protein
MCVGVLLLVLLLLLLLVAETVLVAETGARRHVPRGVNASPPCGGEAFIEFFDA